VSDVVPRSDKTGSSLERGVTAVLLHVTRRTLQRGVVYTRRRRTTAKEQTTLYCEGTDAQKTEKPSTIPSTITYKHKTHTIAYTLNAGNWQI